MYSEIYKSEANSEQIVIREKKASSTLTGHVKKNPELNLSKKTSMPNPPKEKVGMQHYAIVMMFKYIML